MTRSTVLPSMCAMQATDITVDSTTHPLDEIRSCVVDDLQAIDELIINELNSNVALIEQITRHIIKSGGKRLRPLLVILSARAYGYTGHEHIELATIIEFVHTATLLHDDVVDESSLRRGRDTANALWGNQAAVLCGDFLYSRAFQILTRRSNTPIMQCLANTTNAIAEGEVLQLMNKNDPNITIDTYFSVIKRKTAKLFESAAEIGAMLATENKTEHQAAANYGLNLGMAFQIVDDLLDYTADKDTLGKNIGDDLAEGKVTLPLLYAMQHSNELTRKKLQHIISNGDVSQLNLITDALSNSNAIEHCITKAKEFSSKAYQALSPLKPSCYQSALHQLLDFVVERSF